VLNHKIPLLPKGAVRADTQIAADVTVSGKCYRIAALPDATSKKLRLRCRDESEGDLTEEYLYLTSHPREHDLSDVFDGDENETLLRFLKYKYEDLYYSPRELANETDGLSDIKAFRTYLKAFIDNFEPEVIRDGKQYELSLEKGGRYTVKCRIDNESSPLLSESDKTLFRYLCFLRTAEFWHGFECLRNMHEIGKPLIVRDFFERLDESINPKALLDRTKKLKRQVIILTTKAALAHFAEREHES